MSERPLPDDLARWPADPHALLGVSFPTSPRELRRAYNRLIRIYKPEQFPEEFRRIREAYEDLLRFAELFASRDEEPPLPPPTMDTPSDKGAEWIAPSPRPLEEAEEERIARPPRSPEEESGELWQEAIAGRPAAAYERLVQLTQQYSGRTELYLRLYWLLTLWPELDARREPADWLVQGLLSSGQAGPFQELYREELANNPAEALTGRYVRLLEAPLSAGLLADLSELRFDAVARLAMRWGVLGEDLERLRGRLGPDEEHLWLRLVFALADRAAWTCDPEGMHLFGVCREEIRRHEHLATSQSHLFDRFDLLLEASADWRKLAERNAIPASLLRLLAASWHAPFTELREPLMTTLEAIVAAPERWLHRLDAIDQLAPPTLALFGELLDQLAAAREVPVRRHDREVVKGLALGFLPRLNVADYPAQRAPLLHFCVREDLAPEEMAEAASSFTGGWEELGALWSRSLLADWPLRYVCRACRLYWA